MKLTRLTALCAVLSLGPVVHATIHVETHLIEQQVENGVSESQDWQTYLTVVPESPADQFTITSCTGVSGTGAIVRPTLVELLADTTGVGAWTVQYTSAATSLTSTYQIDINAIALFESSLSHPTITSPAPGSITGPNVPVTWAPAPNAASAYSQVFVSDPSPPYYLLYYSSTIIDSSALLTGLPAGSAAVIVHPFVTVGLTETQVTFTHIDGPDLDFSIAPNVLYESWVANKFTVVPEPASLAAAAWPASAALLFRRRNRHSRA